MQPSKIQWTEFVSNPIKGKCKFNCDYCYASKIRQRYKMSDDTSWHPEELFAIEKRKRPTTIFIGSMHDIFGNWVNESWIHWILDTVKKCPQHTFIFLTKNVLRLSEFEFPENCFVGVTDDCKKSDTYPLDDFGEWITSVKKFISFEPLLGRLGTHIPMDVNTVIIGAQTGAGAVKPKREWVDEIIKKAGDRNIFIKDNLLKIYPDLPTLKKVGWM